MMMVNEMHDALINRYQLQDATLKNQVVAINARIRAIRVLTKLNSMSDADKTIKDHGDIHELNTIVADTTLRSFRPIDVPIHVRRRLGISSQDVQGHDVVVVDDITFKLVKRVIECKGYVKTVLDGDHIVPKMFRLWFHGKSIKFVDQCPTFGIAIKEQTITTSTLEPMMRAQADLLNITLVPTVRIIVPTPEFLDIMLADMLKLHETLTKPSTSTIEMSWVTEAAEKLGNLMALDAERKDSTIATSASELAKHALNICAPTGAGKTRAIYTAANVVGAKKMLMVLDSTARVSVHVRENALAIGSSEYTYQVLQSKVDRVNPDVNLVFTTPYRFDETFGAGLDPDHFDLSINDEAHLMNTVDSSTDRSSRPHCLRSMQLFGKTVVTLSGTSIALSCADVPTANIVTVDHPYLCSVGRHCDGGTQIVLVNGTRDQWQSQLIDHAFDDDASCTRALVVGDGIAELNVIAAHLQAKGVHVLKRFGDKCVAMPTQDLCTPFKRIAILTISMDVQALDVPCLDTVIPLNPFTNRSSINRPVQAFGRAIRADLKHKTSMRVIIPVTDANWIAVNSPTLRILSGWMVFMSMRTFPAFDCVVAPIEQKNDDGKPSTTKRRKKTPTTVVDNVASASAMMTANAVRAVQVLSTNGSLIKLRQRVASEMKGELAAYNKGERDQRNADKVQANKDKQDAAKKKLNEEVTEFDYMLKRLEKFPSKRSKVARERFFAQRLDGMRGLGSNKKFFAAMRDRSSIFVDIEKKYNDCIANKDVKLRNYIESSSTVIPEVLTDNVLAAAVFVRAVEMDRVESKVEQPVHRNDPVFGGSFGHLVRNPNQSKDERRMLWRHVVATASSPLFLLKMVKKWTDAGDRFSESMPNSITPTVKVMQPHETLIKSNPNMVPEYVTDKLAQSIIVFTRLNGGNLPLLRKDPVFGSRMNNLKNAPRRSKTARRALVLFSEKDNTCPKSIKKLVKYWKDDPKERFAESFAPPKPTKKTKKSTKKRGEKRKSAVSS
jgi:hypothetical protein